MDEETEVEEARDHVEEAVQSEVTTIVSSRDQEVLSVIGEEHDDTSNPTSTTNDETDQEPEIKKRKITDDASLPLDTSVDNEGNLCTICFDTWTTSGPHRLSSLKCGHLFGYSCIQYWLQTNATKICPTCKQKVLLKDIRFLYANKIVCLDNSDYMRVCEERNQAIESQKRATFEINRLQVMLGQISKQVEQLTQENIRLKQTSQSSTPSSLKNCFRVEQKTREISKEGECRIFAYNGNEHFVVTVKSPFQLFSQYGVRKINLVDLNVKEFIPLHSETIRDAKFHPVQRNILLTVSMDKTAKLVNIESNTVIKVFHTDCRLWSCCWDLANESFFYLGTINGKILLYSMEGDERQGPMKVIQTPNDQSGVVSLTSVDQNHYGALPYGGVVFCKVTDCGVLVKLGQAATIDFEPRTINIVANFAHVLYYHDFGHLLISYRNKQKWQNDQHVIFDISEGEQNVLEVDNAKHFEGNTAKFTGFPRMSCIMETNNFGALIAVYYGSVNKINIYSIETGTIVYRVPSVDVVLDLTFIKQDETLVALTNKRLQIFKVISN